MEKWLKIPKFDGYEASSLGRIRGVDRILITKKGDRSVKGRILRPGVHSKKQPYPVYNLIGPDEVRRMYPAHRLVAWAFIGECPNGYYVCHVDNDPTNNTPLNLYYGSPKENQSDRLKHGTSLIGENHPMAKLSELNAREVLLLLRGGAKQSDIAEKFGLKQPTVSNIKGGKIWSHLHV